jgi:hypothetical protein
LEDLIGNIFRRYSEYMNQLLGRSNVILVKYEEMVEDYRSWLNKFTKPFPLGNRVGVIDRFAEQAPTLFPGQTRDVMIHIRHVTPGV